MICSQEGIIIIHCYDYDKPIINWNFNLAVYSHTKNKIMTCYSTINKTKNKTCTYIILIIKLFVW